jgi:hypothetical protein
LFAGGKEAVHVNKQHCGENVVSKAIPIHELLDKKVAKGMVIALYL